MPDIRILCQPTCIFDLFLPGVLVLGEILEAPVCVFVCMYIILSHIYLYIFFLYVLRVTVNNPLVALTCLLRNLYAGQEETIRTGHGTTHWFQIGKGVRQGCILSTCLFNLYVEYIMRNAGLEEAQAGIKIAGRNINNPI